MEELKSQKPLPTDLPSWAEKYTYTSQTGELLAAYRKDEQGKWYDERPQILLRARIEAIKAKLEALGEEI